MSESLSEQIVPEWGTLADSYLRSKQTVALGEDEGYDTPLIETVEGILNDGSDDDAAALYGALLSACQTTQEAEAIQRHLGGLPEERRRTIYHLLTQYG